MKQVSKTKTLQIFQEHCMSQSDWWDFTDKFGEFESYNLNTVLEFLGY